MSDRVSWAPGSAVLLECVGETLLPTKIEFVNGGELRFVWDMVASMPLHLSGYRIDFGGAWRDYEANVTLTAGETYQVMVTLSHE